MGLDFSFFHWIPSPSLKIFFYFHKDHHFELSGLAVMTILLIFWVQCPIKKTLKATMRNILVLDFQQKYTVMYSVTEI